MANMAAKDRTRSPRYPSYALEDAIGYARKLYAGVHRSPVDSLTAYRLMGFAGKSGASAKALGSMRQFGLIEGIGEKTRVSDIALKILEPASPEEKAETIFLSARQPDVFRSVLDRFDGAIPGADHAIRAFLIRDLGFSQSGADECVAALRKTIGFSEELASAIATDDYVVESREYDVVAQSVPASISANQNSDNYLAKVSELMRIRLSRDCTVELRFEGALDGKALDYLIRHIELQKEVWLEA